MNVFAEWYHPITAGQCWEIAFIGLAGCRSSKAIGVTEQGLLVDDTNDDMLTILEGSFGLEFRRRFGRMLDKYWYIKHLARHPTVAKPVDDRQRRQLGRLRLPRNFNVGVAW